MPCQVLLSEKKYCSRNLVAAFNTAFIEQRLKKLSSAFTNSS